MLALLNIIGTLLDIIKDAFTPDYLLNEISVEPTDLNDGYNRFGIQNIEMQRGKLFEPLYTFNNL